MSELKVGTQFVDTGLSLRGLTRESLGFALNGTAVSPGSRNNPLPPVISNMPAAPSGVQLGSKLWVSPARSVTTGLWDHQRQFVDGIEVAHRLGEHPWLGIASPMQTGKSHAINPIIERIGACFERVVVLCDSRAAYAERRKALEVAYGADHIGQINGKVKAPKHINVAMMQTLVNHLDRFSPDERTLILLDEAITTQRPTVRQILHHFGLGTVNTKAADRAKGPLTPTQLKRGKFIPPSESKHLLVGLSGTGGGLDGYHVVGRYDMLDAISDVRVRHLMGDQVYLGGAAKYRRASDDPDQQEVTFEEKKVIDETQIWWKATPDNARVLAKVYFDRIYENPDTNGRDMIFVPTINHGDLLLHELKEEYVDRGYGDADAAEAFFGFVHSGGTEEIIGDDGAVKKVSIVRDESVNDAEIEKWRAGGSLISVAKLNRSFPATGAGAIFHTYQTTSDELFAQRTGRGWGNNSERNLPSLFVLEATWSRHQKFSNLAKLLGFVDYPTVRLDTRDLVHHIPQIRERRKAEEEMAAAIDSGRVAPMFQNIPLVLDWRTRFRQLVGRGSSRIAEMARKSRIPEVYLQGFAQGGLPTRLAQIEAMAPFIGDVNAAIGNWVDDWRGVIVDLMHGARIMTSNEKVGAVPEELMRWHESVEDYATARGAAEDLDQLLASYFGLPLTGDEIKILQGAVSAYADGEGWQSAEIQNKLFPEDSPKKISANALGSVMFGHVTEPQRASLVGALVLYFNNKRGEAAKASDGHAQDRYQDYQVPLLNMVFNRKGWRVDSRNAMDEFRSAVREAVSVRYGEKWPTRIGSNMSIPPIHVGNTLYKWLYTNYDLSEDQLRSTDLFLNAARLFYSLSSDYMSLDYICKLAVNALMGAMKWDEQAADWDSLYENVEGYTEGEKRRYKVRRAIAEAFLEPNPSIAARKEAGIERMSKRFIDWLHGKTSADAISPKLSAEIDKILKRATAYIKFQKKPGMHRIHRSVAKQERKQKKEQKWRTRFIVALVKSSEALPARVDETIEGDLGELWSEPSTSFRLDFKGIDWQRASKSQCMNRLVHVTRALIHALESEKSQDRIWGLDRAVKYIGAAIAEMNGWQIAAEITRVLLLGKEVRSDLALRLSLIVYLTARYGPVWPDKYFPGKSKLKKWIVGATKPDYVLSLKERRDLLALIEDMNPGLNIFKFKTDHLAALDDSAWDYIGKVTGFPSSAQDRSEAERSLLNTLQYALIYELGGGLDVKDKGYKGRSPTPDSELVRWLNGERMPLTDGLISDIRALIYMKKDDGEFINRTYDIPVDELLKLLEKWIRKEREVEDKEENKWGPAFVSAGQRCINALRLDEDGTVEGDLSELWSEPATPFDLKAKNIDKGKKSAPNRIDIAINYIRGMIHALQHEKAPERRKELKDATLDMTAAMADMTGWPIGEEIKSAVAGDKNVRSDLVLRMNLIIYLTAHYGMEWTEKLFRNNKIKEWLTGDIEADYVLTLQERRDLYVLQKDLGGGLMVFSYDPSYANELLGEVWNYLFGTRKYEDRSEGERRLLWHFQLPLILEMDGGIDVKDKGYKGRPPTPDSELIRWLNGERMPLTPELISDIKALIHMKKDDGKYIFHDQREKLEDELTAWIRKERK